MDWGLGHASRCVPIIKEIQRLGHQVIIGADKQSLRFLQHEFPTLKTIKTPGYQISYSKQRSILKMLFEGIRFSQSIKKEHEFIQKIIVENKIDCIISDNRYGLWSKEIPSIIITHQLFVKAPFFSNWFHNKVKNWLAHFDECWVPDVEGKSNLSGDLSHLKKTEAAPRFIGIISRFEKPTSIVIKHDVIAIVSGPEPQRSIFYDLLLTQLKESQLKAVLIGGNPNVLEKLQDDNVTIYSHLPTSEMQKLITESEVVVCRAGYSSIMDLVTLQKKALLIPTPGQTEQEYLAEYHFQQGNFYIQNQQQFNLEKAFREIHRYTPPLFSSSTLNLDFLNLK